MCSAGYAELQQRIRLTRRVCLRLPIVVGNSNLEVFIHWAYDIIHWAHDMKNSLVSHMCTTITPLPSRLSYDPPWLLVLCLLHDSGTAVARVGGDGLGRSHRAVRHHLGGLVGVTHHQDVVTTTERVPDRYEQHKQKQGGQYCRDARNSGCLLTFSIKVTQ